MNNYNIDIIFDYFKNILDVPNYYCFKFKYSDVISYDKYASINCTDIYIISSLSFHPSLKVNDILRLSNSDICYDMLLFFDDYNMLLINDIIKTLGGVIYEKITLQR